MKIKNSFESLLFLFFALLVCLFSIGCNPSSLEQKKALKNNSSTQAKESKNISADAEFLTLGNDKTIINQSDNASFISEKQISKSLKEKMIKGPLVTTWFTSFKELKSVIQIEYIKQGKPFVRLTHNTGDREVISILKSGISEKDIEHARDGDFWDRVSLALNSPYIVLNIYDLQLAFTLGRRMSHIFGEGDVAFYDLAETMVQNIDEADIALMNSKDLSEKHQINRNTHWTPALIAAYLNDIQTYYSWAFRIGFKPYRTTDQVVVRFANKLNRVMGDLSLLRE